MHLRNRIKSLLIVGLVAIAASNVFATGAFFVDGSGKGDASVVGARAFICRNGAREDLILQAGIIGKASSFAWIIPVPSVPTVRTTDATIFDELRRIMNANILTAPHVAEPEPTPIKLGAVVVISSADPAAITRWLRDNGYNAPADSYDVLRDYIKRKWFFVAVKVKTSPSDGARWMQPIWITFESQKATFPMKMFSLNETPCLINLFVAADHIVKAPGLIEAISTGSPLATQYKKNEFPTFFNMVNREVKLTELRGVVYPNTAASDIVVVPK